MTDPEKKGRALEEDLERLCSQAQGSGAEEWEVYLVRSHSFSVAAREGQIDQIRTGDQTSAAVRLIQDGRLGFAHTSDFTEPAIQRTVSLALAGSRLTDPEPGLALPGPPTGSYPQVEGPDPDWPGVPLEAKMARVKAMESAAFAVDPLVERVRLAEYRESEYLVWLVNGNGVRYHDSGTIFSGSITVKAVKGDDAEMGADGDFSRKYQSLDLEAIGRTAAERAVQGLGGVKMETGTWPIILENRVAAEFLEVLSGSFGADTVQKGKSRLAGRLGQKVFHPKITLTDDGLLPGGLSTSPADGEGVPHQTTVLVLNGVLQDFLYDTPRARIEGKSSTGNAGRGGTSAPPGVSPTNLILTPGTSDLNGLAGKLGEGLLVTEALGVHTANPISGDFSFGVSGIRIKNGRLDHPVKGMALAGNLFSVFENVVEVGSDSKRSGSVVTPSLWIEGLRLSGL